MCACSYAFIKADANALFGDTETKKQQVYKSFELLSINLYKDVQLQQGRWCVWKRGKP